MDAYQNGRYVYLHDRPCDRRRRAKLARKKVNVTILMSVMYMRAHIREKQRAFLIRNAPR